MVCPWPAIPNPQDHLAWAEHLVIVYPLWLGARPVGTTLS